MSEQPEGNDDDRNAPPKSNEEEESKNEDTDSFGHDFGMDIMASHYGAIRFGPTMNQAQKKLRLEKINKEMTELYRQHRDNNNSKATNTINLLQFIEMTVNTAL